MATVNKDFRVKNNINISSTADTATAASHYIVETGSDGIIRPKTLANVKSEILASAALTGTPTTPTASAGTNTTQVASTAFVQTAVATSTINTQTASYTLVLTDAGKIIEMNVATANNLTVPLNSSVAFPIGTTIDIVQYGAGQTTIVATSGVTLRSADGLLNLSKQYSGASLYKRGTDEWVVIGDLA